MTYETLLYDFTDRIATVTLHRPERLNAFNETMRTELLSLFDEIDTDDRVSPSSPLSTGPRSESVSP